VRHGAPGLGRAEPGLAEPEASRDCHPHALLELASRCNRLGALPPAVVLDALRIDRSYAAAPLLQVAVLRRLQHQQSSHLAAAVARHVRFRDGVRDLVRVPPGRAAVHGDFYRAEESRPTCATFEAADGSMLRVAAWPSYFYGQAERHEGAVAERDGWRHVFTSEEFFPVEYFWATRRGRPPFPDYDGGEHEDFAAVPPCATILEEPLRFLPCGLVYSPSWDTTARANKRPRV